MQTAKYKPVLATYYPKHPDRQDVIHEGFSARVKGHLGDDEKELKQTLTVLDAFLLTSSWRVALNTSACPSKNYYKTIRPAFWCK